LLSEPHLRRTRRPTRRLRKLGINESLLGPIDRGAPSCEEFESALKRAELTRGLPVAEGDGGRNLRLDKAARFRKIPS